MNEDARQLSLSIEGVARALSEWSVDDQAASDESLSTRFGDGWRSAWVNDTHQRFRVLAQAVALERPEVFSESVAWMREAFQARAMSGDDLRGNLASMRSVLGHLPEPAADRAARCVDHALARLGEDSPAPDGAATVTLDPLALRYLEAVLDGRRRDAEAMIVAEVVGGRRLVEVYTDVLQPAMVEMGRLWHRGEITVADEHFATATTDMVMSRLRAHVEVPAQDGRRALTTAIEGELHAMGVRMVADFLELDGWRVIDLGANMPIPDTLVALDDHTPDLLAVSCTSLLNLRSVGDLVDAITGRTGEDGDRPKILVGGAPFRMIPDLWRDLGADGSATSAAEATRLASELVPPRR